MVKSLKAAFTKNSARACSPENPTSDRTVHGLAPWLRPRGGVGNASNLFRVQLAIVAPAAQNANVKSTSLRGIAPSFFNWKVMDARCGSARSSGRRT
jgi:hypothetical protein